MIFRQITHDDLGCASYLIGDEDAGVAAVVDPRLDIDEYLRLARYLGVRIEHVLETHNHADHVSGHGRLVAATGATIHIHREAAPEYDHEPFDDGWELELGALRVRALHTPGHRPEHTAFALDRHRARDGAVGGAHRRQPVRRRHRAARPRGRQGRGRARHLPLPAREAARAARHHRGVAGPPRRLAVRRPGDGPEGLLDDRLRAGAPGRCCGSTTRTRSCAAIAGLGPQPPNFRRHRRAQPRAARRWRRRRRTRSPRARSAGADEARWSSTCAPSCSSTRRTSRRGLDHRAARRVRLQARLAGGAGAADRARGARRRGRARAAGLAAAVGLREIAGYLAGGMTSWREERRPVATVGADDGA